MPMLTHLRLTVDGTEIVGGCEMTEREGTMLIYQLDHKIHIPRDPQTGLATGKRIHSPLKIVKEIDQASPLIYQALVQGKKVEAELLFYRVSPAGDGTEEHYFTIKIENGIVVEVKPYYPMAFLKENEPYRHMEEVSFTYSKITWTHHAEGTESEDDWLAPA